MITISWGEGFFGLVVLLLVELSVHLRFRPLRIQLATIESLLRKDQITIFETLGEHAERLDALEERVDSHLKK